MGEKWLVAAFILVGLGATITSIICGYRAAYGWPRIVKVMSNEQLQAWYEKEKTGQGRLSPFSELLSYATDRIDSTLASRGNSLDLAVPEDLATDRAFPPRTGSLGLPWISQAPLRKRSHLPWAGGDAVCRVCRSE